ncbi:MAG: RluA family pseudouridine synthase [Pseudomonadota bacterium]
MTLGDFSAPQHTTISAEDDGIRLDRWFKRHIPQLTFGQLSRMARKGEIRLDGKRAEPKTRLAAGQDLRLPPLDGRLAQAAAPKLTPGDPEADRAFLKECVIHEDDWVLAINKPPGLPTQGGSGVKRHIDGMLRAYADPAPRLVHRLDKDTSGVLVLGKTAAAAAALADAFRQRETEKVYHALCIGVPNPQEGRITAPLKKLPIRGNEKMTVDEDGKSAITDYRLMDRAASRCALMELQPLTGRTHQLRVHMASLGCPIVGDGKYGGQDAYLTGTISRKLHLHAARLRLAHPNGSMLSLSAEYPAHMAESCKALGLEANQD